MHMGSGGPSGQLRRKFGQRGVDFGVMVQDVQCKLNVSRTQDQTLQNSITIGISIRGHLVHLRRVLGLFILGKFPMQHPRNLSRVCSQTIGDCRQPRSSCWSQGSALVGVASKLIIAVLKVAHLIAELLENVLVSHILLGGEIVVVVVGEWHSLRIPELLCLLVSDAAQGLDLVIGPRFKR